jgi:hypothetical protein
VTGTSTATETTRGIWHPRSNVVLGVGLIGRVTFALLKLER